jgi:hypothetical protein
VQVLPDFNFTFDNNKTYRWMATNASEKDAFIKQLWKASMRYLTVQKPEFVNVSIPVEQLGMCCLFIYFCSN